MQVIVNGLVTNYQKSGTGPVVLLLHGWGDNLSTFDGLVKELKLTYTVLRLDLPGFGGTDTPGETFNLELYARFVKEFLNKINSDKIYAIMAF